MQFITIDFKSGSELKSAIKKLWNELELSGELSFETLSDKTYRLKVISESKIKRKDIESLGGKLIEEDSASTEIKEEDPVKAKTKKEEKDDWLREKTREKKKKVKK